MMRVLLGLSAAALSGLLAVNAGAGGKNSAPEKLQGVYTIVRGENEGKPVPGEEIQGSKVVITDRSIVSTDKGGKKIYVADYKLDRSEKPYRITMTIAEGKFKGKTAEGIIAREGDMVKLCYALPGGKTPVRFSTQAGGHQLCFVLRPIEASPK